jgi:hypothetical protein
LGIFIDQFYPEIGILIIKIKSMKKITFYLIALLFVAVSTYANNTSGHFKAEIVVTVKTAEGNKDIKFNFDSVDNFKNFDIGQIGSEKLSNANTIVVSIDSGYPVNYVSFKLDLSSYNHVQKKNEVQDLCQYVLSASK